MVISINTTTRDDTQMWLKVAITTNMAAWRIMSRIKKQVGRWALIKIEDISVRKSVDNTFSTVNILMINDFVDKKKLF